jgi:hypothetical protein
VNVVPADIDPVLMNNDPEAFDLFGLPEESFMVSLSKLLASSDAESGGRSLSPTSIVDDDSALVSSVASSTAVAPLWSIPPLPGRTNE